MKSVNPRSKKQDRDAQTPQQQPREPTVQKPHLSALSPCDDLHDLIAKRAYELYSERKHRGGSALDDWLNAEREILSQIQPAAHARDGHA